MKKIMTSLALIAISISASAQTKDTFVLKTVPHYDEFGNLYTMSQSYDHIPTSKDSDDFKKESNIQISVWIDSMYKTYHVPTTPTVRKKVKRN
jgi:hypothetical protein